MIDHAPRFRDDHNCGLLAYSQETAESLYSETNIFLARWKISKVSTVNHIKTMLNVLSAINYQLGAQNCSTCCIWKCSGGTNADDFTSSAVH